MFCFHATLHCYGCTYNVCTTILPLYYYWNHLLVNKICACYEVTFWDITFKYPIPNQRYMYVYNVLTKIVLWTVYIECVRCVLFFSYRSVRAHAWPWPGYSHHGRAGSGASLLPAVRRPERRAGVGTLRPVVRGERFRNTDLEKYASLLIR